MTITRYLRMVGRDYEASMLLTNGGVPPIPRKILNQRQRRKIARQNR